MRSQNGLGITACSELRFRVHPFCGHQGGGLLQKTPEDREDLRKCKKRNYNYQKSKGKSPKLFRKKKDKYPKQYSKKKEKKRKIMDWLVGMR